MKKTGHTKVQLGEIANVFSGFAFKSSDLGSSGIPVIKIGNIQTGCVQSRCADHFPKELFTSKLDRYVLQQGDSLVAMTGAGSVGKFGRMLKVSQQFLVNQRVGIIRPDKAKCDPAFVFYVLSLPNYEKTLYAQGLGAGQPNVSAKQISDLEVPFPPLDTQHRIAAILSAYDDLIENNTRRIAILEEMARRIYEEWFVRFRFPGHEQVKMVESELGLIPVGWKVVSASDAMTINPKVSIPKVGLKPFVPMGSLSENSMLISDIEKREGNSGSKFQNGDTLFARITPCLENGKTGFVQFLSSADAVAFGSTEFIVLRSRTLCPEYVYALARSDEFRANAIKSMSGATGRQRVREACFDSFFIAQPCSETLQRYREIVHPMFAMIKNLASKNANLRVTRDLLLSKLISGEFTCDLPDLDDEGGYCTGTGSPFVTLTIDKELSPEEIRRVTSACRAVLELYTLEEHVQTLPDGYIGFITKEQIRENINLAVEVFRKEVGITTLALLPLMGSIGQNVLGNLATDVFKAAFPTQQVSAPVDKSRVAQGPIQYSTAKGTVCGQLNPDQLRVVLEMAKVSGAVIECQATGYKLRFEKTT